MASAKSLSNPGHTPEPGETSYRPVRVVGLLLILQMIGLAGIGVYEFTRVEWDQLVFEQYGSEVTVETESEQVAEAVIFIVFFIPPAVLMLLAGLSLLLLKRRGWLLAAIAQGLSLGICLFIYTNPEIETQGYIYPIMIYCILMILYLNSQDVRVVFHSRRGSAKQGGEATYDS
jgi:hypothetical membrane protein